MWDLVFIFGIFVLLGIMFEIVRANMDKLLEANPRMRDARSGFDAATQESNVHIQAMLDARARCRAMQDLIDLAKARIKKINEDIEEIAPDQPVVVREIGKPLRNNLLFDALVTNRYMRFQSRPALIEKMNPIWGRNIEILVWAQNRIDAKRAVDREFPADLGFEVQYGRAFSDYLGT